MRRSAGPIVLVVLVPVVVSAVTAVSARTSVLSSAGPVETGDALHRTASSSARALTDARTRCPETCFACQGGVSTADRVLTASTLTATQDVVIAAWRAERELNVEYVQCRPLWEGQE